MKKLKFTGLADELLKVVNELKDSIGFNIDTDGTEVTVSKREKDGLTVKITNEKAEISYGVIPDFCRGLCVLTDAVNKGEKDFSYDADRGIEKSGIMLDLSRNAVVRVETAKDLIRRCARMGLNTFMLYMENIYKIEEYPYFGYMRGAYTEDELRAIDEYALLFGVEVVPCIQTLGHLSNALRWPYAAGMKDTNDILLIDEPQTYEFIEAMIKTLDRCLSTNRIHVGMDEAFQAGKGRYKALHGEVPHMELIGRHLSKVKEVLDKYGKTPIMWCDMLMRYCSAKGQFWDMDTVVTEEDAKHVPKGYDLAYWDYYFETEEMYDAMFGCLKKMSDTVSSYGGVWTWGGMSVNYDKTFRTTFPMIKSSRKNGINEICATLWGDDGGEVSFYTALLGIQLFAEAVYHEDVDMEHLGKMFKICTGYDAESFLALDVDEVPETLEFRDRNTGFHKTMNAITMSKQMLYQDVLQGLLDKQYEKVDFDTHYTKCLERLDKITVPEDLKELFDYHRQLTYVLKLKAELGRNLTSNYKAGNIDGLKENLETIKLLYPEVQKLHDLFSALWLKNNKAFGLDRIDLRFGGLLARIKRAEKNVAAYINGEIPVIEELTEEKLMFTNAEFLHCPFYCYYSTASMQIEKQW